MIQSTENFFQELQAIQEVRKAREQENVERAELREKAYEEYYAPKKISPEVVVVTLFTIITLAFILRSKFRGVHSNKLQD